MFSVILLPSLESRAGAAEARPSATLRRPPDRTRGGDTCSQRRGEQVRTLGKSPYRCPVAPRTRNGLPLRPRTLPFSSADLRGMSRPDSSLPPVASRSPRHRHPRDRSSRVPTQAPPRVQATASGGRDRLRERHHPELLDLGGDIPLVDHRDVWVVAGEGFSWEHRKLRWTHGLDKRHDLRVLGAEPGLVFDYLAPVLGQSEEVLVGASFLIDGLR